MFLKYFWAVHRACSAVTGRNLTPLAQETKSPGAHGKHLPGLVTFRPMIIRLTELWTQCHNPGRRVGTLCHMCHDVQFAARPDVKSGTATYG
jgi:hypothetical protein